MDRHQAVEAARKTWARVKSAPLLPSLLGAAMALGLGIFALITLSGPTYTVLFDGLTPARGGAVIDELQKLGIPYQLRNGGTLIEVPASQLAQARLELGRDGVPADQESTGWAKLEDAPMTASETATRTMALRATETSLENSIQQMSGATQVKVFLGLPRDTPFLGDQPHPKASVILISPAEPDHALGSAVARLVAGAVPGLSTKDVVVETKGGTVLFPADHNADVQTELALQQQIEDNAKSRLRDLLTPSFGARNIRVSVAAAMVFQRTSVQSTAFGPHKMTAAEKLESHKRVGSRAQALGIPGALSNQPPGPTTAPLNPPQPPPPAAANPGVSGIPAKAAPSPVPGSSSKTAQKTFDVDETQTITKPASWHIRSLAVSVVINQGALNGIPVKTVKQIVRNALAASKVSVSVDAIPFLPAGKVTALTIKQPILAMALRGALILLAAVAILLGVASPLTRFGRALAAIPATPPEPEESPEEKQKEEEWQEMIVRIKNLVEQEPEKTAETLQKWVTTDA